MSKTARDLPKLRSRREFLRRVAATGLYGLFGDGWAATNRHTRAIPSSGEQIPVVGMGSYITFNVGEDARLLAERVDVMRAFFAAGGGMIDSSPMYGSSESTIGHCLRALGHPQGAFCATKVWTWFGSDGARQMEDSRRLWDLPRFDLMQIHNLLSWEDHLETIRRDRDAGLVRYIGVTTSHGRRHEELERVMRTTPLDFVQLTYNVVDRDVEQRLLPLAADRGIAVIVNRPFQRGDLIEHLAAHPLPPWAADVACTTWAQLLLKFIVSHPAVTCVIPATSRADHMRDNMLAATGPLPDAAMRRRLVDYVAKR